MLKRTSMVERLTSMFNLEFPSAYCSNWWLHQIFFFPPARQTQRVHCIPIFYFAGEVKLYLQFSLASLPVPSTVVLRFFQGTASTFAVFIFFGPYNHPRYSYLCPPCTMWSPNLHSHTQILSKVSSVAHHLCTNRFCLRSSSLLLSPRSTPLFLMQIKPVRKHDPLTLPQAIAVSSSSRGSTRPTWRPESLISNLQQAKLTCQRGSAALLWPKAQQTRKKSSARGSSSEDLPMPNSRSTNLSTPASWRRPCDSKNGRKGQKGRETAKICKNDLVLGPEI